MQFSDFFYTHLLAKPQSLDIPKGMHFACHNTSSTRSIGACRPGHAYPGANFFFWGGGGGGASSHVS